MSEKVGILVTAELRVRVDLTQELDVAQWAQRHADGLVPDQAPYGLNKLSLHGVHPTFRAPVRPAAVGWFAGKVRDHFEGLELVAALAGELRRERGSDAVLCMDERTGLPASLVPKGPPVVSGIAWIKRAEELRPRYRALVRRSLPRLDGLWTNVAPMVPLLRREWGLSADRVHLVPLGIDAEFYPQQPWPEQAGLVVSAGEDRMRDHALLIDAVRRVRGTTPNVHLELASSLPVQVEPGLLTLHRRRMNGEMRGIYRRSTVVAVALHPTSLGSGLTVVLEAMASGRPIVVTANPGLDEYVEHGVTGILVPPGDPEAFAGALRDLLSDSDRAQEMGRNARMDVERRWTTDHMAAGLAALIRRSL